MAYHSPHSGPFVTPIRSTQPDEAMRRLATAFGELTVDAFASGATAQLPRFWSREAVDGAEGVDAFAQQWAGEHLLVHAPVGCLGEVIEKLEREPQASAVVVCPYWTGAPWYEPLAKLAADSLILPVGSLRAVATHTGHVKAWRTIAFHVEPRPAEPPPHAADQPSQGSFRRKAAMNGNLASQHVEVQPRLPSRRQRGSKEKMNKRA